MIVYRAPWMDPGVCCRTIAPARSVMLAQVHVLAMLAKRLRCLLERPDLCAARGATARRRVKQEFIWSVVAECTAALYADALAAAGWQCKHRRLPVAWRTERGEPW